MSFAPEARYLSLRASGALNRGRLQSGYYPTLSS
jgi:hypothetical protein